MTMPTFVTKFVKTLDEIYDEVLKFIKTIIVKVNKFVDIIIEMFFKGISDIKTMVISGLFLIIGLDILMLGKLGFIDFIIVSLKSILLSFANFNTVVLIVFLIGIFLYLFNKK